MSQRSCLPEGLRVTELIWVLLSGQEQSTCVMRAQGLRALNMGTQKGMCTYRISGVLNVFFFLYFLLILIIIQVGTRNVCENIHKECFIVKKGHSKVTHNYVRTSSTHVYRKHQLLALL